MDAEGWSEAGYLLRAVIVGGAIIWVLWVGMGEAVDIVGRLMGWW